MEEAAMIAAAFKVVAGVAVVAALGAVTEWKTDLVAVGDSGIVGEASVAASMGEAKSTTGTAASTADPTLMAKVNIKGGKDGAALPWHLHAGTCGSANAPIVGDAKDYEPIKVGSTGEGSASASINAQLADSGQYLVNVHKSAEDLTVVSCGQLKRTGDATEQKQ
jgi:hypothetical protein